MLEWPVVPPRHRDKFFAHAACFPLRALAAQNHNGGVGLKPDLGCIAAIRLIQKF